MSFRNIEQLPIPPENPESPHIGMAGGFSGEGTPKEGILDSSPSLEAVRFQGRSVRKDFGFQGLGGRADNRVLGLIEHKFISDDQTFSRLIRFTKSSAGKLFLEVLVGGVWALVGETAEDVNEVPLSVISIQGVVLIADGQHLWIWEETVEAIAQAQDFPEGNLVTVIGNTVDIDVSPGGAIGDYTINFDAKVIGNSENGVTVVVDLLHNGDLIDSKSLTGDPSTDPEFEDTFNNQSFVISRSIADGDTLSLKLKGVSVGGVPETITMIFSSGDIQMTAEKTSAPESSEYTVTYSARVSEDDVADADTTSKVTLSVRESDSDPWTVIDTTDLTALDTESTIFNDETFVFFYAGLIAGSEFRIEIAYESGAVEVPSLIEGEVSWLEATTFDEHSQNMAMEDSPTSGNINKIIRTRTEADDPYDTPSPLPSYDNNYRIEYQVKMREGDTVPSDAPMQIAFQIMNSDGTEKELIAWVDHFTAEGQPSLIVATFEFYYPGLELGPGEYIRGVISAYGYGHGDYPRFLFRPPHVEGGVDTFEWETVGAGGETKSAEIHGHNLEVDGDATPGLEYNTAGSAVSVLELVSVDAPGARFLAEFADRAVALRDGGDTQSFAWPVSGDLRDWIGAGSGQLFLVSSSSDPIDNLQAFASIGSNVGALFRSRSIMRAFPTGNISQALGVVKWINGVGTESMFSVKNVEGGVMFLGHSLMVYFLNESGLRAVGHPIHQELIRTVTSNLDIVDAVWDPIFNEYLLGVPEGNSNVINKVWVFDVRRFLDNQELIWRPRSQEIQRFAITSQI